MKKKSIVISGIIIVIVLIGILISFHKMSSEEYYVVEGEILDVIYLNGLSDYYIKLFFVNETESFRIDFSSYTGCDQGLDDIYCILMSHKGSDVSIKYTKAWNGENGFVDVNDYFFPDQSKYLTGVWTSLDGNRTISFTGIEYQECSDNKFFGKYCIG